MKRLAWVVKKRPLSIVSMHPLGALSRIEAVALLKTKSWRKKKKSWWHRNRLDIGQEGCGNFICARLEAVHVVLHFYVLDAPFSVL